MLLVAVGALVAAAMAQTAAGEGFDVTFGTDVTTYRLWPKTGAADENGLTNVDSGDAAGDLLS
eukprot:SAG31_NODE_2985_length_4812_cov_3.398517_1_plen_63_part_00